VRLISVRPNVVDVRLTTVELSALVAAARLAADAMARDAAAPPELLAVLRDVLADYDRAAARLHDE
jgi:hypothetical protein